MFTNYLKQYKEIIIGEELNNDICYDGVVDKATYDKQKYRLMFLLKETNGNDEKGNERDTYDKWSYMQWVGEQAMMKIPLYRSIYRNIAMWSSMFRTYAKKEVPKVEEYINEKGLIINSKLCESLSGIAIINLKKSWGKGNTDWNALNQYLNQEEYKSKRREILKYQLSELKPTVVLCGGTFYFAKQIFGEDANIEKANINDQIIEYFRKDNILFVDCYHPSKPGWARVDSYNYADNIFRFVFNNFD